MTYLFGIFLICSGLMIFIRRRLYRYLHYFQQEEYDSKRFMRWLDKNKAFDRKSWIIILLVPFVSIFIHFIFAASLAFIAFLTMSFFEEDPRKTGKIRLKMTERATRIYKIALGMFVVVALVITTLAITYDKTFMALAALLTFSTPFFLILACLLLQPGENKRQKQFLDEAKKRLASVSPYVIGITGSYGKTSTKDALSQILQITLGPTFWPSKGINTPMGITREIRSSLFPEHQYAVIEMGAYGIGSIKRLCDLTPPNAAIITTIGSAHLERFGTKENIRLAKSELAQAVPYDGILICNGDDADVRHIAQQYPKKTTRFYGFNEELGYLDCWVSSWHTTTKGTEFTVNYLGRSYEGFTPLFGQTALSNVIGSFLMACTLGSHPEYALAVIRNLEPVSNRLQVQQDDQITYIHDAYNSNPQGFAGALQVLKALPSTRKILMTPGMIELGTQQQIENERLAQLAGGICDLAIVVGETNRKFLMQGLLQGGMKSEQIFVTSSRDQAFKQLAAIRKNGDLILIENDLPDLYEAKPKF